MATGTLRPVNVARDVPTCEAVLLWCTGVILALLTPISHQDSHGCQRKSYPGWLGPIHRLNHGVTGAPYNTYIIFSACYLAEGIGTVPRFLRKRTSTFPSNGEIRVDSREWVGREARTVGENPRSMQCVSAVIAMLINSACTRRKSQLQADDELRRKTTTHTRRSVTMRGALPMPG